MGELVDIVVRRTIELAGIPAPSMQEQERSEQVAGWWSADGLVGVHRDRLGNVWARVNEGRNPAVVVCAHLDTVFAADVDHADVGTASS